MTLHDWDTGAKYKDGDAAIVNGIEARATRQDRNKAHPGCRVCPAYNPCKQHMSVAAGCTASLGPNSYWVPVDLFLQLRIKGEL